MFGTVLNVVLVSASVETGACNWYMIETMMMTVAQWCLEEKRWIAGKDALELVISMLFPVAVSTSQCIHSLGIASQNVGWILQVPLYNDNGEECLVSNISCSFSGRSYSKTLQQAPLSLLPRRYCQQHFHGAFTSRMLCAGSIQPERRVDSCRGDSGGPLVCERPGGGWVVYGVTSWGHACRTQQSPGVYTKVSAFSSWIRKMIGPDAGKTKQVTNARQETEKSDLPFQKADSRRLSDATI